MPEQSVPNNNPDQIEREHDKHARAIERLTWELDFPAEEIARSYTEILEVLKKDAKVRAFLPVLVSRCVKERFSISKR